MPQRNSWENNGKRWDERDGKRPRDSRDQLDDLGDFVRRVAQKVRDDRKQLQDENDVLRKRLREENGGLHDRLKRTQDELNKRTAEVAVYETKLEHASKACKSMVETAFGPLIGLDSASNGGPNASGAQEAEPEVPNTSNGVVLPEGPGEAARTPTEAADDTPGPVPETLKDDSRCASPSL